MGQIEVPYAETRDLIAQKMRGYSRLYLATSHGDYVTVRMMGFACADLKIWFATDKDSRKFAQIAANPRVAIAGPELQIEGVASLKGHPMDEENANFIIAYRELQPERFEASVRPGRMLDRSGTRVIEVNPWRVLCNVWSADWDLDPDFEPHILILNVPQEKAYRVPAYESGVYLSSAYTEIP